MADGRRRPHVRGAGLRRSLTALSGRPARAGRSGCAGSRRWTKIGVSAGPCRWSDGRRRTSCERKGGHEQLVRHAFHLVGRRRRGVVPQPRSARTRGVPAGRAAAVLAEGPAREPPAPRGRPRRHRRRRPGPGRVGPGRGGGEGDRVHARPGPAARLHGGARGGRSGGHAGRGRPPRRRPGAHQSPAAGRAGHRPLGAGRSLPGCRRVRPERAARILAEPRALRLPEVGPAGVRQLPGGAPRHGHRASGEPGVPGAGRVRGRRRRPPPGLARHAGGHRLAHHHGQRPRRRGLGRGRHRGRGGHAGAARLDAHPRRRRVQARRPAARRDDGDRPRADHHRAAAAARRGRQVRRVLRPRAGVADSGRPGHARQHVARVRLDGGRLPRRSDDARLSAAERPGRRAGGAGRRLHPRPGHVRRAGRRPRLRRRGRVRSRRRRAEHRGAQAAPGPGGPRGCGVRVRAGVGHAAAGR